MKPETATLIDRQSKFVSGVYEGRYIDILGHEGDIMFSLNEVDKNAVGQCRILISSDDDPSVYQTVPDKEFSFPLKETKAFNRVSTTLFLEEAEEGFEPISIEGVFELQYRKADPFFSHAIYGTVEFTGDPGVAGGTFIAWMVQNQKGGEYAV